MLESRAPAARARRLDPVRRVRAHLHRHRDLAGRSRLGDPAKFRHAGEPRQAAPGPGPRPARDPEILRLAVRSAAWRFRPFARQRPRRADGNRAALRQYDVSRRLRGGRRGAAGDRPWAARGDPAGRRLRPAGQSLHADDNLGAGIFPRLSAHQIRRGRPWLVPFARQRDAGHEFLRSPLLSRSCRW